MEQNQYISILIEVGNKNAQLDELEMSQKGLSSRVWLPLDWKTLNDDDLVALFKGLVIIEEYWFTRGEHIGSTTETKFVYHEIRSRGIDKGFSLGDWAFQYSSNPYVPMDTGNRHGAKTIFELFNWEKRYQTRVLKEKDDSVRNKEEKKRLKAEAHAERLKQKEIRDRMQGYKK